jgi:hypothetical protein
MHSILDGKMNAGFHLNWRGSGATAVSLFASIVPFCDISSESSIIITLAGSAPASLSAPSVVFTSPTSGSNTAIATVSNGVLTVKTVTGSFNSGQLIEFSLPGTITNAAKMQPSLNNVSVCIVDSMNVIRSVNRSVFFHAIHESGATFSHSLTGYTASAVGVKTFGSFKIQSVTVGNVLLFTYPIELFTSSR